MGDHVKSIAKTEVKDFHSCFLILGYGHFIKGTEVRHDLSFVPSHLPLFYLPRSQQDLLKDFLRDQKEAYKPVVSQIILLTFFYSWMKHLSFFNHWVLPYLHDLSKMVKMMCNETS